jgi:MFS transporter, DHA2 family, multidrug resistance protein
MSMRNQPVGAVTLARSPTAHSNGGSATQAPAPPAINPWLVTLAITAGAIMGALDTSIVNVALPYIQSNLGVSITEVAWISTGYIIALVIVMPLTAWLSARFGRKRVYMICLAIFTLASFACGSARTLQMLTFFRIIQGFGAGAMQPVQQAILRESFPQEKQGMAMGIFGLAVMIGPAIGPTLGGWITDNYNWPWIFYINVPIGVVALWMVNIWVHDPPYMQARGQAMTIDALGIVLLTVGLASLQTVLEEGQQYYWFDSTFIVIMTIIAIVSLLALIWWELRTRAPAIDLSVLKDSSFSTGTFIGGILGVGLYSSMFLLPLFMQELLGYSATKSGLVLMPRSVAMLIFMPVAGALYNRLGPRPMIGSGLLIAGFAPIMMAKFSLQTPDADFLFPQVIQGVGFDLVFVALSTAALSHIPKAKMTSAAGLYNLIRQLGGSLGTAVFATMLESSQQSNRAVLVQHINPYNPTFQSRFQLMVQGFQAAGADLHKAQSQALALLNGMVNQQAGVLAFERAFFIIGLLFFICLPLVLILRAGGIKHEAAEPMEI